jgi:plastocyanin
MTRAANSANVTRRPSLPSLRWQIPPGGCGEMFAGSLNVAGSHASLTSTVRSPEATAGAASASSAPIAMAVAAARPRLPPMQKGFHNAWNFDRDHVTLRVGDVLTAVHGRGGELHTFTQVDQFGPGCIPFLNGGQPPPALCYVDVVDGTGLPLLAFQTAVVPGGPAQTFTAASSGTFFFQCLIHPWMRTTVTVR